MPRKSDCIDDISLHVTSRLRSARYQRGITLKELGACLGGLGPSDVQYIFLDLSHVSAHKLFVLAHALQVPIDSLFDDFHGTYEEQDRYAHIQDVLTVLYEQDTAVKRKYRRQLTASLDEDASAILIEPLRGQLLTALRCIYPSQKGHQHPISKHVGRKLRLLREEAGMDVHDMSAAMHTTSRTVEHHESGNAILTKQLYDYSNQLDVSPGCLFDGLPGDTPEIIRYGVPEDESLHIVSQKQVPAGMAQFGELILRLRPDERANLRRTMGIVEAAE